MQKDKSMKLPWESQIIKKQIFKNKYQLLNNIELVYHVASHLSKRSDGEVRFTNLDFKNAYSQLSLDEITSKQCSFSIVKGIIRATY